MDHATPLSVPDPTGISGDCATLFVSLELSRSTWVATSLALGSRKMSKHTLVGGDARKLLDLLGRLKSRAEQRMAAPVKIVAIQEVGLDGFWIHRLLEANGVESHVVDPASIAVPRRHRRAKTDAIDGETLLRTLMAWQRGEPRVCAMTVPPSPSEEDRRRVSRERAMLLRERIRHTNRIRGLLFGQGISNYNPLHKNRREDLEELRTGDDRPVPAHLKAEILREIDRLELVLRQITEVEAERDKILRSAPANSPAELLMQLKGIGPEFAGVLYLEGLFRHFENRWQLAVYAGLAPSPWKSGSVDHEQGISKAAYHNDRTCLDVGEMPARQCSQLLVPPARWLRARADPPHLDRSTRPQAAHCPLEIYQPWRDPGGCYREASLRHPGRRKHYRVPRGLISPVGSGRADRHRQWL